MERLPDAEQRVPLLGGGPQNAYDRRAETARIPIIVLTAKRVTAEDHQRLDGAVTTFMEKGQFDRARFTTEVRRAMSGRQVAH